MPSAESGSKAIASLAKKPQPGSQKLKFVPTLPVRRKKDGDVKQEEPSAPLPSSPARSDRGRGRGRDRDARGAAPRLPPAEMTASGPFAMGPSLAGASARRSTPRSNFAPIFPSGPSEKLGSGLTQTTAPSLKKEKDQSKSSSDDDAEVYSEPDEGVEIVDMDDIKKMDWMAPESLLREPEDKKRKKKQARIKQEESTALNREHENMDEAGDTTDVNLANAVDLSESEEEEELEDIIDDFSAKTGQDLYPGVRQEQLYFFQFPSPFPAFTSSTNKLSSIDKGKGKDTETGTESPKRVTFTDDTKPGSVSATPASTTAPEKPEDATVDGIIGRLELYRSGAVKMRLANGILMDVTAATQPSFLQHSVYVDRQEKRLCVLGEINRRFVVTPDIASLLDDMGIPDDPSEGETLEGLISMDTT